MGSESLVSSIGSKNRQAKQQVTTNILLLWLGLDMSSISSDEDGNVAAQVWESAAGPRFGARVGGCGAGDRGLGDG